MKKINLPNLEYAIRRYYDNTPLNKLAVELGISRITLTRIFRAHGVKLRTMSESIALARSQMTPEARSKGAEASHNVIRGRKRSEDELIRRANTRSKRITHISPAETMLADKLKELGLDVKPQFAVGKYNVDLLVEDLIAVEIYGGGWHHQRNHAKRDKYIMNQGFDRMTFWVYGRRHPLNVDICSSHIVGRLLVLEEQPHLIGESLVFWGDGGVYNVVPRKITPHH